MQVRVDLKKPLTGFQMMSENVNTTTPCVILVLLPLFEHSLAFLAVHQVII